VSAGHGNGGRRSGARPGTPARDHDRPPRPRSLRRYGQNHLVDANVLGVILALAGVHPDDVVLEVGAATGVLTGRLVDRARTVHAFEIDGRFAAGLEELAAQHPSIRLHVADALKYPLDRLVPAPRILVANLAYNIAIPLVVETIGRVPSLQRWAVMVQKELAERLFAEPGTKAYSAVSVLVQLACERTALRQVPRTAFSPVPRVDSVFVTFGRRAGGLPPGYADVERLVRTAFGQRRKMMVNSLAGAARGGIALERDDVRRALAGIGVSERARPEELAPGRFVSLARALGWAEEGR
jgi:16S rRNA (adenine1518-N6/adenine1519-N6)-dimethyltransferase